MPAVHPGTGATMSGVRCIERRMRVCQTAAEKRHLAALGVPDSKLLTCGLPPMCLADGTGTQSGGNSSWEIVPVCCFCRRDKGKGCSLCFTLAHRLQALDACLPRQPRWSAQGRVGEIAARFLSRSWACGRRINDALASCNTTSSLRHESFGIATWKQVLSQACHLRAAPACEVGRRWKDRLVGGPGP
jgi:hypothetical protein